MIPFNLKERKYKNHPKDGLYGVIQNGGVLSGYPVTIVDDSTSEKTALVLIHLAEDIRSYSRLTLYEDFLYLSFANPNNQPTYRMFDYAKREMTEREIIQTLKKVIYDASPELQTQTCLGWSSGLPKDNPNRFKGSYVLNNEKEYRIEKYTNKIKFFVLPVGNDEELGAKDELLYEEELNFEIYEKALEVKRLRRQLVMYTNQLLDSGMGEKLQAYEKARKELDEKLKAI